MRTAATPDTAENEPRGSRAGSCLAAALLMVVPIAMLFGPVLLTDRVFAMRDSAHFYYPLYEWTTREWAAGRIPLWNPQENLGVSVLGESTSAIFYPGQLVFALPVDFGLRYKLYIVSHVFLAAFASYYLARRLGTSRYAAAMAGMSYSCGGSVLFQYCNVPFLIGAAWLPLALAAAYAIIDCRSVWAAVGLAVCLAMMVLGGDPQAAYHALLLVGLLLLINVARTHWFERSKPCESTNQWVRATALLLLSIVCTFCLAAIQILPSYEWTRTSERAIYDEPRNIYEAASVTTGTHSSGALSKGEAIAAGLVGQPKPGTHQWSAYEFSIGPWRLAELVWPNVGGRMFPTNRRWFSLIPAEGRVWSPSLYMGLIPFVLALSVFSLRSPDMRIRWLCWIAVLFVLGSFGWFGLGWAAREIYALAGGDEGRVQIGSPVGGVYWLLMTVLPMYAQFRYPAKLFVVAALAISQLAALGLDRAMADDRGRFRNVLAYLGIASGAMAIVVFVLSTVTRYNLDLDDPAFGPFDTKGAQQDALWSLTQSCIVAIAGWWLLSNAWSAQRRLVPWVILTLVAVELLTANRWIIATAPGSALRAKPALGSRQEYGRAPIRIYRQPTDRIWPAQFARESSPNRPAEIAEWERRTLAPKHHLTANVPMANSSSSLKQADHEMFLSVARARGTRLSDGSRLPHPSVLPLLRCQGILLEAHEPPKFVHPATWRSLSTGDVSPNEVHVGRVYHVMPHAWIVHSVERLEPLTASDSRSLLRKRTDEVLFPGGVARDFTRTAVVESDSFDVQVEPMIIKGDEPCRTTEYRPEVVRLEATLEEPGLLVIADAYAPGWIARDAASGREYSIVRTNRVIRGVWLEAGSHVIEFRYEPKPFYYGAAISLSAWSLLLLVVCFGAYRSWRAKCCSSAPA